MEDSGRGFSLLSLMIVLAIILTLLAISVSHLLHSKIVVTYFYRIQPVYPIA